MNEEKDKVIEEKKINKIDSFNEKLSKVIEAINATEIGKIEIDGKKYTTVATRTEFFRKEFGFEAQIITDLINVDEDCVIAKAEIGFFKKGKWFCVATGHAEEKRNSSKLNEVSALEIAETSAIGRALSNLGLSGGEFASANEVLNSKEEMNNKNTSNLNNKELDSKKEKQEEVKETKITNSQKEVLKGLIKETNTRAN